jgi:penicillin-binding protein 1A
LTSEQRDPLRRLVRYWTGLDRHWRFTVAATFAAVVLVALTFAPLVRTIATNKAAARGLELDIGHVRPGWFSIHLGDVKITLEGVPAVRAAVDRLEVGLTPWFGLRAVSVEGGELSLDGTVDALRTELEAWRARHRGSSNSSGSAREALPIDVRGVNVTWRGAEGDAAPSPAPSPTPSPTQSIVGISFERHDGAARAGFESARLDSRWGAVTLSGGAAEFRSTERGLALDTARVALVLGRLVLPSEASTPEASTATAPEPLARAASDLDDDEEEEAGAKAPAKVAHDQKTLAARLAPVAARSWPERREQIARLRALLADRLGERARIDIEKVQLEVTHGSSVLNVGPAPLEVRRADGVVSASFLPPADKSGKRLALNARLPLGEGSIEVSLEGGPISLQTLGVREGDFGLLGVDQSALSLQTHVELSPTGALGISASGRLEQLSLEQPALAPEPLRDVNLNWSGELQLDLGQRRFAIENAELGLQDVRVKLEGSIEATEDDVRVALSVDVPKTSCQDMLASAPAALLPQLEGLRLGGTFALHSRIALDTSDPKKTDVEWDFDNRCKVLDTPEEIDPKRFREPFQHFVMDADGRATELTTGPTTEQWVPLSEITPAMETGLVVCEDSRFFKHNGFDNKAIRDSILDNLRAGHFVRGASTLSMQLAKNLYLSREKTLSRKLQEAAFTLLLEERLSKEDILELYLNVVEFGPGIYGIRSAAMHYFNSHPGELSLGQAMYLASILPNPKANHFLPTGALKPRWAKHLQYLMRVARKINRIGDDELEAGMKEQLVFGQAHPDSNSDFLFGTPIYDVNDG